MSRGRITLTVEQFSCPVPGGLRSIEESVRLVVPITVPPDPAVLQDFLEVVHNIFKLFDLTEAGA